MSAAPVLTVDGPSGTGKGTVSRAVAARLGWHFLDSGALYRVTGLAAREAGLALDDGPAVAALARTLELRFAGGDARREAAVLLAGRDVTTAIRSETAGGDASRVAALAPVRAALLDLQRGFRHPPGLVADGRDMGTTVFPAAEVKVFLDASPEERANRRHKQLIEKGIGVSLPDLVTEIAERDRRDREREASPLRAAPDAVVIDTTELSIDAVIARVMQALSERGLAG